MPKTGLSRATEHIPVSQDTNTAQKRMNDLAFAIFILIKILYFHKNEIGGRYLMVSFLYFQKDLLNSCVKT